MGGWLFGWVGLRLWVVMVMMEWNPYILVSSQQCHVRYGEGRRSFCSLRSLCWWLGLFRSIWWWWWWRWLTGPYLAVVVASEASHVYLTTKGGIWISFILWYFVRCVGVCVGVCGYNISVIYFSVTAKNTPLGIWFCQFIWSLNNHARIIKTCRRHWRGPGFWAEWMGWSDGWMGFAHVRDWLKRSKINFRKALKKG